MTCSIWTVVEHDVGSATNKKEDRGSLRTCMFVVSTSVICHTQPRDIGHLFYTVVRDSFLIVLSLFFVCRINYIIATHYLRPGSPVSAFPLQWLEMS